MFRRCARMACVLAVLAGCVAVPAAHAAKHRPKSEYFLSLGDSYAVGYQGNVGHTTHQGRPTSSSGWRASAATG